MSTNKLRNLINIRVLPYLNGFYGGGLAQTSYKFPNMHIDDASYFIAYTIYWDTCVHKINYSNVHNFTE